MLLGFSMATCAVPVSVPGAAARFDAPEGYTPLSQDEISIKFPARRAPANIVGNARRTTTIAFELKQDKLAPEQLSEARQVFEQFFERTVPGLVWRDRKLVRLDGQNWIHLEFSSNAVDSDLHNIMLVTSRFGGGCCCSTSVPRRQSFRWSKAHCAAAFRASISAAERVSSDANDDRSSVHAQVPTGRHLCHGLDRLRRWRW